MYTWYFGLEEGKSALWEGKINSLQKTVQKIQNDNTKTHEEVMEVTKKMKEDYQDETILGR